MELGSFVGDPLGGLLVSIQRQSPKGRGQQMESGLGGLG